MVELLEASVSEVKGKIGELELTFERMQGETGARDPSRI